MTTTLDKPLHRERTPARLCKGCHSAWLTSANEDDYCWQCGGWSTQRLSALEAIGHGPRFYASTRGEVGAALEELMAA